MTSWVGLASTAFRAAANTLTSIPPPDPDLPLLRRLLVLGQLSTLIYDVCAANVGQTQVYTLPLATRKGQSRTQDNTAIVTATLMHVRDVDLREGGSVQERMESPQKFGVWLVSGLGVVVAFRGTANEHDMMVNLELNPAPVLVNGTPDGMICWGWLVGLYTAGVNGRCMHAVSVLSTHFLRSRMTHPHINTAARVQLHGGFYRGCLDHIEDILSVVAEARNAAGGPNTPLWLTGHSLGGAYAAVMTLHLLVNHAQHAALFSGGTAAGHSQCGSYGCVRSTPCTPRIGSSTR